MSDKPTVRQRILAGIDLVDAEEACAQLQVETNAPEAVMQSHTYERTVIDLIHHGRVLFPRFRFDAENARVFGVVNAILKIRPSRISNLRLVYWMTRRHADFDQALAEMFGQEDAAVIAAFRRNIEPEWHG